MSMELHGWFSDVGADLASVSDAAHAFEELGVSMVWVPEAGHDPFLTAAALMAQTRRLIVGTGVAVAYARTPFATAQAAFDLQRSTNGRFRLGLGTQVRAHIERRYGVAWPGGAAALLEYVECCRAIWECWQHGQPADYEGRYFRFTLSNPSFEPLPLPEEHAPVPIWLGTVGPHLARVVGEVADGFYAHAFHTPAYIREVLMPAVALGASARRREPPKQASSSVFAGIVFDSNHERLLRGVFRKRLAFYASTPTYVPVLEHAGFAELHGPLRDLSRQRRWEEMATLVPDEMLEAFAVFDEPRRLGERLAARYQGLLSGLTLYPGADQFAGPSDIQVLAEALAAG